ncbi:phenylalanine--tRNA ligase subunit alpha [Boudabousia liubingyangii]|uniref:Phenylalanine--tRNA ligase alpha subunit n=1 Tax=Boudabousia liubingyangii TaxID=1921764 RepID=A0A1Q5PKL5_9ACTO|nr:phenylalanine--tRNA ligase subunit alpha [Boudabousia liubingyangii]
MEEPNVADQSTLFDQLDEAVAGAQKAFAGASTVADLKQIKGQWIGDKSVVTSAKKAMKDVPPEKRAEFGKKVGAAKNEILAAYDQRAEELAEQELAAALAAETVDVTAPVERALPAGRHPLELLQQEIGDYFTGLGWSIAEGPELEHEWFNFDALNIDADHPARAMQDTFYIDPASINEGADSSPHLVLRTHTSPVQARTMTQGEPPFYMACPGKVFRSDELDATHTPVFHQVEGLAVDRGLTMAHLKGVLDHFAQAMFGPEAKTRLRPSFFPFTEPSAEMDLWFPQKKGGPGWIEWGGCGMVNPNVLSACGIDPEEFQGFAFGMGIERTLMLRHGISDMHDIVEGDVRFSQQFGLFGRGQ